MYRTTVSTKSIIFNNELHIFKFSPNFSYCFFPRYKYFRQHPAHVHPQHPTKPQSVLVFSDLSNYVFLSEAEKMGVRNWKYK